MSTKTVTLKAYEFCTPKFGGNLQYEKVYDYELVEKLFNCILKLEKPTRKYKNETVSINLGDFRQSNDANIVEGYFITARHGKRLTQIDIDTQEEIGTIEKHHGVENEVYFMIDRRNGLLLVQEDYNKVFTRKLLHTFLHSHKELIYPYIDKYNELNQGVITKIHKRSCFRLLSLPPIDFLEKLRGFTKVKSATLTLDNTTDKRNVDVSNILDKELEENNIENYDLEIKIKNKTSQSMVKVFEKYFASIIEHQKYDSYSIEGELTNGKTKKISPDTVTRDFYIDVSFNINGLPSINDIFKGMERIIFEENLLPDKGPTPNSIMVGEDNDLEKKIQQIIADKNQKKEIEKVEIY